MFTPPASGLWFSTTFRPEGSMKIAAVTAGAQGIGRAIARHFAKAGYAISITDSDVAAGEECAHLVEKQGARALFSGGDIADPGHATRWIEQTVSTLGCPDLLVNNAGIMIRKPFLDLPLTDFDRVIAVNLRSAFVCSQAVAQAMVQQGKAGAIINIASTRAFMSEPGTEGYTASKGGLVALTHGMAISLAPHRIRVNCISPGWIETADWQYSPRAKEPDHSREDREQHPVGRVGRPEDIASACWYLAEAAGFMTGQNIVIDGGMSVKMIYAE
jgi:NAD(P)-dependent dehydrogenase (short-subunit alcohol dehydrogenase family)